MLRRMKAEINQYWWVKYKAPVPRCDIEKLAVDKMGAEYTRSELLDYMAKNGNLSSEKLLSKVTCPRYLIGKRSVIADVLASRDIETAFVFSEKLHTAIKSTCRQASHYYR